MKVVIIEKQSRSVVATVLVSMVGLNYNPGHSEIYEEAWKSAVEDGLITQGNKYEYEFQIITK